MSEKLFSFNNTEPDKNQAPVQNNNQNNNANPSPAHNPSASQKGCLFEDDAFQIEDPLEFHDIQTADRFSSKEIAQEISTLMSTMFYDYVGCKVTWDPGYMLSDGYGSLRCQLLFRYTAKPKDDNRVAGCESTYDTVKNSTVTRDQAIILANTKAVNNDFSCTLTPNGKKAFAKYVPDRIWYTSPTGQGSGWIIIKERNRNNTLKKVHWQNVTHPQRNSSFDARTGRSYEFQELVVEIDVNKLIRTLFNGTKEYYNHKNMQKYDYKVFCNGVKTKPDGQIDDYMLLVVRIDVNEEKKYAIQQGYGTLCTDNSGWI